MNTFSIAALSGALLGLLIVVALRQTRGERAYANRLLAWVILLSTAYLFSLVSLHSPEVSQLAFLKLGGLSVFLFGPSLYLYVRAATETDFRVAPIHLLHSVPALFILADQFELFAWVAGDADTLLLSHRHLLAVLFYLQLIAYLVASSRLLYRFHLRIAESYSSLEGIKLRWLGSLVAIALILSVLGLAFALGRGLFDAVIWPQRVWSIGMLVTINYLIAFFAITQPSLFNPSVADAPAPALPEDTNPAPLARYETSSLTPDQAREIWNMLEALMVEARPYLQPQLKIADLAVTLNMPVSHLSQTINQVGECSFFVFVNRYRVNAARDLLQSTAPGARTMLDIALTAGFNSESAFYKQFRKHVGITPRQFQLKK